MSTKFQSPLVIGGVGGSGTRVVAFLFQKAGVYLGNELNQSLDNLVFTRLFKNPSWKKSATQHDISGRLRLFESYMAGGDFGRDKKTELLEIMKGNPLHPLTRAQRWRFHFSTRPEAEKWGWKEPNSLLYLRELANHFASMRFILVIRHGLDMAFSENLQQLRNWGEFYGVEARSDQLPSAQLDYWIAVNRDAIENGDKLLKERFYVLNFDHLWMQPEIEVAKLLSFAGLSADGERVGELISIPRKPPTARRFQQRDHSGFSRTQLEAVEALGFDLASRS